MLSLLLLLSVGRAVLPTLATTCSGSPPPPVTVSDKVLLAINNGDEDASVSTDCKTPAQDFVGEDECATAAQAAVGINLAFEAFNITSHEQAALVIGQMIAESGGFQMSRNHYQAERQDGKDCSDGCDVGFFGKGTYSMWPPRSLGIYAVMEGVVTQEQIASMSGEEMLALINGPTNPHAYGPAVWFLKHGKEALRPNEESCSADFGDQVDEGIIEPYFRCLHGPSLDLSETAQPQPYLPTLFSGKEQDCAEYAPEEEVVVSYPAGVVAIQEATVSPPDLATPSAATSVPGDDWIYTGFESTQAIVTTIGPGGSGGDDDGADGNKSPEEEEEDEDTEVTEISLEEDGEGEEELAPEGEEEHPDNFAEETDDTGAEELNEDEEGGQNDQGGDSGASRLQAAASLLLLVALSFLQL